MQDPCKHLRQKAAEALVELNRASEAMAEFSIITPYQSDQRHEKMKGYLQEMQAAFERERIAWESYYTINLELLECIRDTYREFEANG